MAMADRQSRYEVPDSPSSPCSPVVPVDLPGTPMDTPIGPVVSGYGAELVGHTHQTLEEGAAIVHLPRDTRYVLRLSNANSHLVVVRVEVDEVHVGTFLLNRYTFCDLERPLDRPLAFTFCYTPEEPPPVDKTNSKARNNKPATAPKRTMSPTPRSTANLKTTVKCIFQPALGARTMELDIRGHGVDKVKRYELAQDLSVCDLFRDLAKDFGSIAEESSSALIHWTNAEYDSPVEEVLTPEMETRLGNSLRKDDPLRKMSLVVAHKLEIRHEDGHEVILDLTSPPRFGDVMESIQRDFTVGGPLDDIKKEKPLYFITRGGRVLGSSAWFPSQSYLFEVLHKDELLETLPSLQIDVTSKPPKGIFSIFVRILKGAMHELLATRDTSLRELRLQLLNRGGPYQDDTCWLFCGKLLEASKPLSHYDIRPRNTLDVFLRTQGPGDQTLRREDPIAVEGVTPISTVDLLKSPTGSTAREAGERRLKSRGTTLAGRSTQQFIEVDPIATDERFYTGITLTLAPDDEELISTEDTLEGLRTATGSGCDIM